MKQNYKLFGFAAMAALLLSGCSKDVTDDVVKPEEGTFTLVIIPDEKIEAFANEDTRTYWDEETENVKWSGKEYMYILMKKNQYQLAPNNNGQFSFNYNREAVGDELFQANVPVVLTGIVPERYPDKINITNRQEAPNKIVLTLPTAQNSTAASFDPWLDVMVGSKEIVYTAEQIESNYRYEIGMPFARVMAISKYTFSLANEELSADETVESVTLTVIPGEGNEQKLLTGSYNLNISAIPAICIDDKGEQINLRTPFTSGSPSVSTTYAADAQPKLGELAFWPITAPVKLEAGDMLRFCIVTNKHEITKEIVLSKDLYYANNKLNRATVKLDADVKIHAFDEVIDLNTEGTANSYIINKPRSNYKFRADVKGNDAAQTIEPKGAVVIWYNCVQPAYQAFIQESPIVLESVKLVDGCIEFSTPETFVNGNVVIAAIDQPLTAEEIEVDPETRQLTNANVLWSWNLICSNGYDPNETLRQYSKGGYTMMDRDLGAVIDPDPSASGFTKAAAAGNTYQWGRKDAFPGIPDYHSLAAYSYFSFYLSFPVIPGLNLGEVGKHAKAQNQVFGTNDADNCVLIENTYGADYTVDQALECATKNPHLWVRSSKNSWVPVNDQSHNLWGKGEVKTINDPCPVGWKVMSETAWMALSDNLEAGATAYDVFIRMDGQIFPLFEGRNVSSGATGYSGSCNANIFAIYYTGNTLVAGGVLYGRVFNLIAPYNYNAAGNDPTATIKMENRTAGSGARIRCIKE